MDRLRVYDAVRIRRHTLENALIRLARLLHHQCARISECRDRVARKRANIQRRRVFEL